MRKKIFCFLSCVVLLAMMLPMAAFAATPITQEELKPISWGVVVALGLAIMGAATVATVIILKKKSKGECL